MTLHHKKKYRRLGRRSEHIGRTRWKLWSLLQDAGFGIPAPDCFWMQEGGYRHHYWDLARWGADWRDDKGGYHSVYSWDTMTDCARYGITATRNDRDLPGTFEIHSNKP